MYDSNLKAKWDYENSIAYAKELAAEEGLKKGIEKGIGIGIEKGIDMGIEKGRHDEASDIAIEMKKDGIPIAQIAKFTKLPIEEIEKL